MSQNIIKGGVGGQFIEEGQRSPLSGNVNFGNGARVGGPDDRPSSTIIQVRGGDEKAEDMTVFISVEPFETSVFNPVTDLPYIVAKITWGSGGVSHQVVIDVGMGTSFSLMGSFVRVDVSQDPGYVPGGVFVPPARSVMVQGFISQGRHIGAPATRTLYFYALAAGATSARQPIPAFARNVRVSGGNPNVNYQFRLQDLGGTKVVTAATQVNAGTFSIPNDGKEISVTNPGLAAADLRAVFELNL